MSESQRYTEDMICDDRLYMDALHRKISEITDEQWEQLQYVTKKFKYLYPHAISGHKPMPEC